MRLKFLYKNYGTIKICYAELIEITFIFQAENERCSP